MTVRVRFAPNPSGSLHLGSAEAALYNWLFARHEGGTFIVRLEDTDPERARPEMIEPTLEALRWLGLDWDEGPGVGGPHGPYRQSERLDIHREGLAKLVASGHAYPCWCTRDEIVARGTKRGYDRHCRYLDDAAKAELEASGKPYALRFAVPEGEAVVAHDVIRGELRKEFAELQDFAVARSDGSPLYRLAAAYDDILMGITHVVRGADVLEATYEQVLIFRALGAPVPEFVHVPVVLAPDRAKLSKRHGSVSIQEFRDEGFLPEAMVNALALLGWSSPSQDEILTRERLVREFSFDRMNASPSVFDKDKLRWMNQEHIKALPPGELEARVLALSPDVPADVLRRAIELEMIQTRVVTLADAAGAIRYLHEPPTIDPQVGERFLGTEEADGTLGEVAARLESLEPWTVDAISDTVQAVVEDLGLHRRKGPQPVRVAVSGSNVSLPLYESIWIIGRDGTVSRLRAAIGWPKPR